MIPASDFLWASKVTSGLCARMKIKPQPKQIPDTPGDHPTRIELAVQDAIGVKPQARARTADFVAFALTLLRPENRYEKAPKQIYPCLSPLASRPLRSTVRKASSNPEYLPRL